MGNFGGGGATGTVGLACEVVGCCEGAPFHGVICSGSAFGEAFSYILCALMCGDCARMWLLGWRGVMGGMGVRHFIIRPPMIMTTTTLTG